MLTPFEYAYLASAPLLPPLYRHVRVELFRALAGCPARPAVLDVGGRKSHYTIGVPAALTITDVARVSETQVKLHLGIDESIRAQTRLRRSNIVDVRFDDMTRTALPPDTFDVVLAVEVLEHVEEDERFVANVARVLRPGGTFIMTTPNGDWVPNTNPDHKRHYKRQELHALLERAFADVTVEYAIRSSRFRRWGLRSWSARRPVQTVLSMVGNVVNTAESRRGRVAGSPTETCHLIAMARRGAERRG